MNFQSTISQIQEENKKFTDQNEELRQFKVEWDPRFPNQNQTRNCWQNYVDFYRCTNLRGDDYQPCQYFFKKFTIMCPPQWVERWDEQRDKDAFPVKFQ